jgi:hypothetical protein
MLEKPCFQAHGLHRSLCFYFLPCLLLSSRRLCFYLTVACSGSCARKTTSTLLLRLRVETVFLASLPSLILPFFIYREKRYATRSTPLSRSLLLVLVSESKRAVGQMPAFSLWILFDCALRNPLRNKRKIIENKQIKQTEETVLWTFADDYFFWCLLRPRSWPYPWLPCLANLLLLVPESSRTCRRLVNICPLSSLRNLLLLEFFPLCPLWMNFRRVSVFLLNFSLSTVPSITASLLFSSFVATPCDLCQ